MAIFTIAVLLVGTISYPISIYTLPSAAADGTECDGTLTAAGGPYGDVSVEEGKSCTVEAGTIINGDFEADEPVDITIRGSSVITISGNVKIEGATGDVKIENSDIGGNVEIKDGTATSSNDIFVRNNIIGGDIEVEGNTVVDDISVNDNKVVDKVEIEENSVGDDLKCADNDPAPTGDDNTVDGIATGQCSGF